MKNGFIFPLYKSWNIAINSELNDEKNTVLLYVINTTFYISKIHIWNKSLEKCTVTKKKNCRALLAKYVPLPAGWKKHSIILLFVFYIFLFGMNLELLILPLDSLLSPAVVHTFQMFSRGQQSAYFFKIAGILCRLFLCHNVIQSARMWKGLASV